MRSVLIQALQEIRRFGEIDKRTIKLLTKADIRKLETDKRIVERNKRLAERRRKERNHPRRPSGRARTIFPAALLPVYSPLLRHSPDEQPRLRELRERDQPIVEARKTIAGLARLAREPRRSARDEEAKAIACADARAISLEPALSAWQVGEGKGPWLSPFADAVAIHDDGVRDLLPLFDLETSDPLFDGNWPTQKEGCLTHDDLNMYFAVRKRIKNVPPDPSPAQLRGTLDHTRRPVSKSQA